MATPLYPDGTLQDYLLLYCEELNSGILVIFFLIAAIIFFWADERNGFVKNIAGQTRHKSAIFLSKLLVIGIFVFASMLCYLLVEYLSFRCGLADADIRFGMERLPEACKVFATEYLLYMAYISGLLLLTEVTKSTAVSITMGILGITGFGLLLSGVIMKIFHTDFDVSKYYINTCITTVGFGEGGEVFRFALCIGGIFLVFYTALHVYWFVKRDIV